MRDSELERRFERKEDKMPIRLEDSQEEDGFLHDSQEFLEDAGEMVGNKTKKMW